MGQCSGFSKVIPLVSRISRLKFSVHRWVGEKEQLWDGELRGMGQSSGFSKVIPLGMCLGIFRLKFSAITATAFELVGMGNVRSYNQAIGDFLTTSKVVADPRIQPTSLQRASLQTSSEYMNTATTMEIRKVAKEGLLKNHWSGTCCGYYFCCKKSV